MASYSIVCTETWTVLETIEADNPSIAKSIALDKYPHRPVTIVYNEDYCN